MAIMLDTEVIEPRSRADIVAEAIQQASAPAHVKLKERDSLVRARLEAWEFGDVHLTRFEGSGFEIVRTPKQVRVSPSPVLSISLVQGTSTVHLAQFEIQHVLGPGDIFVMDQDQPWDADWSGGRVTSLQVPLERLALSIELIRRATPHLLGSPLYPLVANYMAYLVAAADAIQADPAAPELGDACAESVCALLTSASRAGGDDGSALPAGILLTQIREYVGRHLSDADLTPARIARAHNISVRYLYKLCAHAGFRLTPWIIDQRLCRVRTELANPENRHRTIAAIAYRYGFRDPSHFTRRFRAAYDMTPTQWRRNAFDD